MNELKKISTVAREKGVSRGAVYQKIALRKLNSQIIDGQVFVVADEKYEKWQKKGK